MKKKMYILRTWMWDERSGDGSTPVDMAVPARHPTELTVFVAEPPLKSVPLGVPYITTSRLSAKKFYTKKDAVSYGKKYGGCYADVVWRYQIPYQGETLDLWR